MNLTFHMKSGNKITADRITKWNLKHDQKGITSLSVTQKVGGVFGCKNRVYIETMDVTNIECVVEH